MKKMMFLAFASAIAVVPAARAQVSLPSDFSIDDSSDFKRGEGRKGGWIRGQGPVAQHDQSAGQGERSWNESRSEGDSERRERRRGDWNPQQQGQQEQSDQRGTWRGDDNRRSDDYDNNRRRNGGWNGANENDRRWENRDDEGRGWDGRRDDDRSWNDRRDNDRRWEGRRDDERRWNDDHRYGSRERYNWDRSWRSDRRYDWRGHRDRYRSYYRPGRYYAPNRYDRYRRFTVGIYLGSPFYSNRYWIADPWYYRLPRAHGPYRWVRYYDDVLLVDIRNGYVLDVIHDFFW